jgi:hypothetical protein
LGTGTVTEFRYYPEERHWWSFNDYRAVAEVVRRRNVQTVLEFGPGSSTLALIEGGATRVDTCEDDPEWAAIYQTRLAEAFPTIVRIHPYVWADPIVVPTVGGVRYDLALIDGPRDTARRPLVIAYCLANADAVLIPLEEAAGIPATLRPIVLTMAAAAGRTVEMLDTGPLAGTFALLT